MHDVGLNRCGTYRLRDGQLRVGVAIIGSAALLLGLFGLVLTVRRKQWRGLRSVRTWQPVLVGLGLAVSAVAHLTAGPTRSLQVIDLLSMSVAVGLGLVFLVEGIRRSDGRGNTPTGARLDDLLDGAGTSDEITR